MKKQNVVDKRVARHVATMFITLACDHTGQPVNAKCINRVMRDIVGQRKFFSRLCNIKTDTELRILFNGATTMDILSIFNNEAQINILRQTIELEREISNLKRKIKKHTKNGKKCKNLEERYHKLHKIYNKSVKTFKSLLGIKDMKKDAKPKDKYSDLIKFHKKYSGNDEFGFLSSYYDDDEDDYDDYAEFTPDQYLLMGKTPPSRRRNGNRKISDLFDDDEDDDLDLDLSDDDEDDEDDDFDLKVFIENQDEKMTKILSAISALISLNQSPKPQSPDTTFVPEWGPVVPADATPLPYRPSNVSMGTQYGNFDLMNLADDDDEDDDEEVSERLESLDEKMDMILKMVAASSASGPSPVFVPTKSEEQKEIEDLLAAITDTEDEDDENPSRFNGMSTPELIGERNAEVSSEFTQINTSSEHPTE